MNFEKFLWKPPVVASGKTETQQQEKSERQETKEALWDRVVGHAVSYMIPEKNWKSVKTVKIKDMP